MEGSSSSGVGCDKESVLVTPSQKQELLKSELQSLNINLLPSTDDDDNSSVASMNEGCESPLSSWDSEPETDIPSLINCDGMLQGSLQSINLEENYLDIEEQYQFVGSYEELLKKFKEKEEELRVSNFKLQLSEQEIIKLNGQVENVREELKLKEEELNKLKELSEEEIFKFEIQIEKTENRLDDKLQKQYAELYTYSPEFVHRIRNLVELHEAARVTVNTPKYENAILKKELEKKSIETHQLQGQLKKAQKNLAKSELELVSSRNQLQKIRDRVRMYKANENKAHFDTASSSKMR